jgi:hypothetical protein
MRRTLGHARYRGRDSAGHRGRPVPDNWADVGSSNLTQWRMAPQAESPISWPAPPAPLPMTRSGSAICS